MCTIKIEHGQTVIDCPAIEKLQDTAADLLSSQQAMPDEASVDMLRVLVASAYKLGRSDALSEAEKAPAA